MAKNSNRGSRNNNPSGRNQYSDWGVMEMARERPIAAATAAMGAAAAGLFLWSRRAAISNQIGNLSDQIGEWTQNMQSGNGSSAFGDDTAGLTTTGTGSSGRSATSRGRGMSETGGGNASLGRQSGSGIRGSASNGGRAKGGPSAT